MFGIPGKQAVSITDKAATQIAKLMAKDGSEGLRIGVKKAAVRAWNTPWNTSVKSTL